MEKEELIERLLTNLKDYVIKNTSDKPNMFDVYKAIAEYTNTVFD